MVMQAPLLPARLSNRHADNARDVAYAGKSPLEPLREVRVVQLVKEGLLVVPKFIPGVSSSRY